MIARRIFRTVLRFRTANLLLLSTCLVISACSPALEALTGNQGTEKNAELVAQQVLKFATQTAAVTGTTLPSTDELEVPSPTPQIPAIEEISTPTAQLERSGLFQQISAEEALIAGRVISLESDPDGGIWLISEDGISHFDGEVWSGFLTETTGEMVGMDRKGHFWLVSHDGTSITSWDQTAWISYTISTGWEPIETELPYLGPARVTSDQYGNVWLSSESGVRMFDGTSWQIISDEMMGMPEVGSPDLISQYLIKTIQDRGEVWVGRCDWSGPGPINGGGVRVYDGGNWLENQPPFDDGCITEIEEGTNGDVWVGREAELWKLSGQDGRWEQHVPPAPPEELGVRFGYVVGLAVDPNGDPWAELEICGGASCYNGEILYHLIGSDWEQIGEVTAGFRREVLFDEQGNTWIISGGSIYRIGGDETEQLSNINVLAATSDHEGGIWLLAQGSGAPTLWVLDND